MTNEERAMRFKIAQDVRFEYGYLCIRECGGRGYGRNENSSIDDETFMAHLNTLHEKIDDLSITVEELQEAKNRLDMLIPQASRETKLETIFNDHVVDVLDNCDKVYSNESVRSMFEEDFEKRDEKALSKFLSSYGKFMMVDEKKRKIAALNEQGKKELS